MQWIHDASYALGGAFLANALPHLVSGVMGHRFQSPFATPPGQGLSSSTVNVLWGFLNLAAGYGLTVWVGTINLRSLDNAAALGAGFLLTALMLARAFGRFNGGPSPGQARGVR